jgi:competence protein ComEC
MVRERIVGLRTAGLEDGVSATLPSRCVRDRRGMLVQTRSRRAARGSGVLASLAAVLLLSACSAPAPMVGSGPEPAAPAAPEPAAPAVPEPAAPQPEPEPAAPAPERPAQAAPTGAELVVRILDVGQGDAMLLTHPDVTVLIDTGRFDRSDVVPLLRRFGVDTIDLLVVTHPHADHIGQFDRVMAAFTVEEVWWSGSLATTRTFERALAALEASDARYEEPRGGQTTTVGPLLVEILHPGAGDSLRDLNDASISLRITYGEFRIVTTGDAERAAEARMVARWPDRLAADVLRLGHHGSSTSTSAAFLDAVAPSVAIYSAGAGNRYGHPHAEVVDLVAGRGIMLFGTATGGTITIVTDGTTFDVRSER